MTKEYDTSDALVFSHRALYKVSEECVKIDIGRGRVNVYLGAVVRFRDPVLAGV